MCCEQEIMCLTKSKHRNDLNYIFRKWQETETTEDRLAHIQASKAKVSNIWSSLVYYYVKLQLSGKKPQKKTHLKLPKN